MQRTLVGSYELLDRENDLGIWLVRPVPRATCCSIRRNGNAGSAVADGNDEQVSRSDLVSAWQCATEQVEASIQLIPRRMFRLHTRVDEMAPKLHPH